MYRHRHCTAHQEEEKMNEQTRRELYAVKFIFLPLYGLPDLYSFTFECIYKSMAEHNIHGYYETHLTLIIINELKFI